MSKLFVNGIEVGVPCKKQRLDEHLTPSEIKKLVQDKQKEIKEREEK